MSDRGGFIVLWRKALDSWLFDLPAIQFKITMRILLEANWRESTAMRKGRRIPILRGQLLASESGLAKRGRVSRGAVRRTLSSLEKAGFLSRDVSLGVSVITVVNYAKYQDKPDGVSPGVSPVRAQPEPEVSPTGALSEQGNKVTNDLTSETGTVPDPPPAKAKKPRKPKKDPSSYPEESKRIAWELANLIGDRLPNSKVSPPAARKANAQRWVEPIDRLHRANGIPYETIRAVMRWSQADEFESSNVLSGGKLNKRFTSLQAKWAKARGQVIPINETLDERNARLYPGIPVIKAKKR